MMATLYNYTMVQSYYNIYGIGSFVGPIHNCIHSVYKFNKDPYRKISYSMYTILWAQPLPGYMACIIILWALSRTLCIYYIALY